MDLHGGPCVLFLLRLCFCRSRGTGLGVEVPDRVERRYQEVRASSPRQEGRCGPGLPNWGREGTGECASNGDTSRVAGGKAPGRRPQHMEQKPPDSCRGRSLLGVSLALIVGESRGNQLCCRGWWADAQPLTAFPLTGSWNAPLLNTPRADSPVSSLGPCFLLVAEHSLSSS